MHKTNLIKMMWEVAYRHGLILAFYNAGMSHKPDEALYKARAHVRRVEEIFAIAKKLGVV